MSVPAREPLSNEAIALVREIAERMLGGAADLFEEVHRAVMTYAPDDIRADPALSAEIERSNAAILSHWLVEVLRDPGVHVAPVATRDTLDFARDVARRGLEDMTFNYFRVGLGVASRYVMDAAFAASDEPVVIREALDYLLRTSSEYVDASAALIHGAIREERARRGGGAQARRLDTVLELLEGASDDTRAASLRLGFELDRPMVAAIIWVDPSAGIGVDALEDAARRIAASIEARPPLVVAASVASVWVWFPVEWAPALSTVRREISVVEGARVALGSLSRGLAGFRASHDDAARTQRVLHRRGRHELVASHEQIRVVALAGADEPAAIEFVRATLGPLATAPQVLRDTLLGVIEQGFDVPAVAALLGVHRNTVLARVRRARELLPSDPVRWIDVALALELEHWLESGSRPG